MNTTNPTPATTRTSPKVNLDATQECLTRLGLFHAADHLAESLAEAT